MFAPETEVRFLSNVDFDVEFANVRDFNTRVDETNYFISKTKFYYPKCQVQGVRGYSGFIIAPINDGMTIDSYYDCNYLMYKNSEISGKWFYAALGTPQVLSKRSCYIPYTIDLWRTWYMDCTIGECYVEREHVNDDTIGKWLKPESVDTGEYVAVATGQEKLGYDLTSSLDNRNAIVVVNSYALGVEDPGYLSIFDETTGTTKWQIPGIVPEYVGGFLCGGVYQGAMFTAFPFTDVNVNEVVDLVNQYIKNIVTFGQVERILGIFMCPFWICQQVAGKLNIEEIENSNKPVSFSVTANPSPTSFGEYVPKNNKMFTGQFNYFFIDNGAGLQEEFQYEYFNKMKDGKLPFFIYGQLSENPSIRLIPDSYKCPALETGRENNTYAMDLSGFPSGSYSYSEFANNWNGRITQRIASHVRDNYQLGKAKTQSMYSILDSGLNIISSVISAGQSGYEGEMTDVLGSVMSSARSGANLGVASQKFPVKDEILRIQQNEAAYLDSQRIPNVISGNANGSIAYPIGYLTFTQYRMQVQEDYARRIDKYLSAFGYTIEEIKTPNLKGRKSWNYVKTANAVVNGNVPEEAKSFISNVLNTGIRIWHQGSTWLDYSQPNDII